MFSYVITVVSLNTSICQTYLLNIHFKCFSCALSFAIINEFSHASTQKQMLKI